MDKKTMQGLIVGFFILLIGGPVLYYKFLLSPLNSRIKLLKGDLDRIKEEYRQSESRAARLPQLQKEIEFLNREIADTEKKLPASKDLPTLIRVLSKKMDKYDISWQRIVPGNQVPKDYYIEHTYTIPFTCAYHSLAGFLTEIGQMERIFATRFSKLAVTPPKPNTGVQVTGDLTFIIYTSRG